MFEYKKIICYFFVFFTISKPGKKHKVSKYIVSCWGVVKLRGSSTGVLHVGPTKVKAPKSFLFTEGSPEVENKFTFEDAKKWH